MLKSFLFNSGDTVRDLQNYGHNLMKLVSLSRSKGLPTVISTENIVNLSDAYNRKRTEYRRNECVEFPQLDLLFIEVRKLQSHVFNHVAKC